MEPPNFNTSEHQVIRTIAGNDVNIVLPVPAGSPPFQYEWKHAGATVDDRFTTSDDSTGVRLTISAARTGDSGVYTLQASNAAGKDTTRVRLEVSPDEMPVGDDPPTFLRRLQDLTVKVGTRTRFLVEIISSTECRVTWYRNERRLLEAERIALVRDGNFWCADIATVSVDDAGRWTCTAENAGGRASCSAHLNVLVPKAYKRPEFVEELRALLTEQGTVSLECKVVGVPTPVLRWFKDSREIKAGDVFALTANAEDPTSLGTYTCEAVNCMGRAYSSSKVHVVGRGSRESSARPSSGGITPEPPPIFTKELEDQFIRITESLVLGCHVVVPPWPRCVIWYNKDGKVEPSEKYRVLEDGVGGYLIEVPSAEWSDEGEWKCVATSATGRVGISTCYVSMDVPKNYRKPRFMENLQAILTEEGLVSFECKVVGFPTPVLSWFKDGQELKPGDVYQLTGTNSLGSYCCIAKNCMGQASSSAELSVEDIQNQLNEEEKLQLFTRNQAPKFLQGLKSIEAKIDEPFRFTVKVAIPPEPSVLWYRDDQPVDETVRCHLGKEERGLFFLNIHNLELLDQAEWKCVAMNDFGHSVTSCFLKLIIPRHYKKPRFLENLQAILSDEGAVNLECKVIGVPQPVLKWYKDGEELKPGDIHRIISGQDGTCCLGTYTCEAHNCMGIAASSASLLGFEDSMKKTSKKTDEQALQRNLSLSTIHEERTSQMYDTPVGDITLDDKGEISFSFDGKEVSVSLYETPDLTEEEALQIVEMYADQLSENVTEHNVVELPPLRFVKETSTSGNLLMEAIIIDVSPDYYASPEEDLRTEADIEDISIADENAIPQLSLDDDVGGEDYLEKTMALLSDEKADLPKKIRRRKSDSQKSIEDYYSLSRDRSTSEDKKEDDTQILSESDLQSFASAHSSSKPKSKSSKPSLEENQESSEITKTVLIKEDAALQIGIKKSVSERRRSASSRRSSSGSDKILEKQNENKLDVQSDKHIITVPEQIYPHVVTISRYLKNIIINIQIIEKDVILKSQLMSTTAAASRSLEVINSVITPFNKLLRTVEALKETSEKNAPGYDDLFVTIPITLQELQQSLTVLEKCIEVETENKTLIQKTCIIFINKCGEETCKLVEEINLMAEKKYTSLDDLSFSSIKFELNKIFNTIKRSRESIEKIHIIIESKEGKINNNLEAKYLNETQKALQELRTHLNSLLCIVDISLKSDFKSFRGVTFSEVILNDMSSSIQDLQTALEYIDNLSVRESAASLPKYNTEIIDTVMNSVLKLRTLFEEISLTTNKNEDTEVFKEVLIAIKTSLAEMSSHLQVIENKIGKFDVLNNDNKLEVLQKIAQVLITLENNLVVLENIPEIQIPMTTFHSNLTKVLENVIESNNLEKYYSLMEACEPVRRINSLMKNLDSDNIISLIGIINALQIIHQNITKNVYTADLNNLLISNIADVVISIQKIINQAVEIKDQSNLEVTEDISIESYHENKVTMVTEHIGKAVVAINSITALESTKDFAFKETLQNICPILENLKICVSSLIQNDSKHEETSHLQESTTELSIAKPLYELQENISVLSQIIHENADTYSEIQEIKTFAETFFDLNSALEILQQDIVSQYNDDVTLHDINVSLVNVVQSIKSCIVIIQEQGCVDAIEDISTLDDISGIKTTAETLIGDQLVLPSVQQSIIESCVEPLQSALPTKQLAIVLQTLNDHIMTLNNPDILEVLESLSEDERYLELKSVIPNLMESHLSIEGNTAPILLDTCPEVASVFNLENLMAIADPLRHLQESLYVVDVSNIPICDSVSQISEDKIIVVKLGLLELKDHLDKCLNIILPAISITGNTIDISRHVNVLRTLVIKLQVLLEKSFETSLQCSKNSEVLILKELLSNFLETTNITIDITQLKRIIEEVYMALLRVEDDLLQYATNDSAMLNEIALLQTINEVEKNIAVLEQHSFVEFSQAQDINSYLVPHIAIETEADSLKGAETLIENVVHVLLGSHQNISPENLKILEEFFTTIKNKIVLINCIINKRANHKRIIRLFQEFIALSNTINIFKTKMNNLILTDDVTVHITNFIIDSDEFLNKLRLLLQNILTSQSNLLILLPVSKINESSKLYNNILGSLEYDYIHESIKMLIDITDLISPYINNLQTIVLNELQYSYTRDVHISSEISQRLEILRIHLENKIASNQSNDLSSKLFQNLSINIEEHQDFLKATDIGKILIIIKCLSECFTIIEANVILRNTQQLNSESLENESLKEILGEIKEPLNALHQQLKTVQEQISLNMDTDDTISIDISSSETASEKNKEVEDQIKSSDLKLDTEDICLVKEVDENLHSVENNLRATERVESEKVNEMSVPNNEMESSSQVILTKGTICPEEDSRKEQKEMQLQQEVHQTDENIKVYIEPNEKTIMNKDEHAEIYNESEQSIILNTCPERKPDMTSVRLNLETEVKTLDTKILDIKHALLQGIEMFVDITEKNKGIFNIKELQEAVNIATRLRDGLRDSELVPDMTSQNITIIDTLTIQIEEANKLQKALIASKPNLLDVAENSKSLHKSESQKLVAIVEQLINELLLFTADSAEEVHKKESICNITVQEEQFVISEKDKISEGAASIGKDIDKMFEEKQELLQKIELYLDVIENTNKIINIDHLTESVRIAEQLRENIRVLEKISDRSTQDKNIESRLLKDSELTYILYEAINNVEMQILNKEQDLQSTSISEESLKILNVIKELKNKISTTSIIEVLKPIEPKFEISDIEKENDGEKPEFLHKNDFSDQTEYKELRENTECLLKLEDKDKVTATDTEVISDIIKPITVIEAVQSKIEQTKPTIKDSDKSLEEKQLILEKIEEYIELTKNIEHIVKAENLKGSAKIAEELRDCITVSEIVTGVTSHELTSDYTARDEAELAYKLHEALNIIEMQIQETESDLTILPMSEETEKIKHVIEDLKMNLVTINKSPITQIEKTIDDSISSNIQVIDERKDDSAVVPKTSSVLIDSHLNESISNETNQEKQSDLSDIDKVIATDIEAISDIIKPITVIEDVQSKIEQTKLTIKDSDKSLEGKQIILEKIEEYIELTKNIEHIVKAENLKGSAKIAEELRDCITISEIVTGVTSHGLTSEYTARDEAELAYKLHEALNIIEMQIQETESDLTILPMSEETEKIKHVIEDLKMNLVTINKSPITQIEKTIDDSISSNIQVIDERKDDSAVVPKTASVLIDSHLNESISNETNQEKQSDLSDIDKVIATDIEAISDIIKPITVIEDVQSKIEQTKLTIKDSDKSLEGKQIILEKIEEYIELTKNIEHIVKAENLKGSAKIAEELRDCITISEIVTGVKSHGLTSEYTARDEAELAYKLHEALNIIEMQIQETESDLTILPISEETEKIKHVIEELKMNLVTITKSPITQIDKTIDDSISSNIQVIDERKDDSAVIPTTSIILVDSHLEESIGNETNQEKQSDLSNIDQVTATDIEVISDTIKPITVIEEVQSKIEQTKPTIKESDKSLEGKQIILEKIEEYIELTENIEHIVKAENLKGSAKIAEQLRDCITVSEIVTGVTSHELTSEYTARDEAELAYKLHEALNIIEMQIQETESDLTILPMSEETGKIKNVIEDLKMNLVTITKSPITQIYKTIDDSIGSNIQVIDERKNDLAVVPKTSSILVDSHLEESIGNETNQEKQSDLSNIDQVTATDIEVISDIIKPITVIEDFQSKIEQTKPTIKDSDKSLEGKQIILEKIEEYIELTKNIEQIVKAENLKGSAKIAEELRDCITVSEIVTGVTSHELTSEYTARDEAELAYKLHEALNIIEMQIQETESDLTILPMSEETEKIKHVIEDLKMNLVTITKSPITQTDKTINDSISSNIQVIDERKDDSVVVPTTSSILVDSHLEESIGNKTNQEKQSDLSNIDQVTATDIEVISDIFKPITLIEDIQSKIEQTKTTLKDSDKSLEGKQLILEKIEEYIELTKNIEQIVKAENLKESAKIAEELRDCITVSEIVTGVTSHELRSEYTARDEAELAYKLHEALNIIEMQIQETESDLTILTMSEETGKIKNVIEDLKMNLVTITKSPITQIDKTIDDSIGSNIQVIDERKDDLAVVPKTSSILVDSHLEESKGNETNQEKQSDLSNIDQVTATDIEVISDIIKPITVIEDVQSKIEQTKPTIKDSDKSLEGKQIILEKIEEYIELTKNIEQKVKEENLKGTAKIAEELRDCITVSEIGTGVTSHELTSEYTARDEAELAYKLHEALNIIEMQIQETESDLTILPMSEETEKIKHVIEDLKMNLVTITKSPITQIDKTIDDSISSNIQVIDERKDDSVVVPTTSSILVDSHLEESIGNETNQEKQSGLSNIDQVTATDIEVISDTFKPITLIEDIQSKIEQTKPTIKDSDKSLDGKQIILEKIEEYIELTKNIEQIVKAENLKGSAKIAEELRDCITVSEIVTGVTSHGLTSEYTARDEAELAYKLHEALNIIEMQIQETESDLTILPMSEETEKIKHVIEELKMNLVTITKSPITQIDKTIDDSISNLQVIDEHKIDSVVVSTISSLLVDSHLDESIINETDQEKQSDLSNIDQVTATNVEVISDTIKPITLIEDIQSKNEQTKSTLKDIDKSLEGKQLILEKIEEYIELTENIEHIVKAENLKGSAKIAEQLRDCITVSEIVTGVTSHELTSEYTARDEAELAYKLHEALNIIEMQIQETETDLTILPMSEETEKIKHVIDDLKMNLVTISETSIIQIDKNIDHSVNNMPVLDKHFELPDLKNYDGNISFTNEVGTQPHLLEENIAKSQSTEPFPEKTNVLNSENLSQTDLSVKPDTEMYKGTVSTQDEPNEKTFDSDSIIKELVQSVEDYLMLTETIIIDKIIFQQIEDFISEKCFDNIDETLVAVVREALIEPVSLAKTLINCIINSQPVIKSGEEMLAAEACAKNELLAMKLFKSLKDFQNLLVMKMDENSQLDYKSIDNVIKSTIRLKIYLQSILNASNQENKMNHLFNESEEKTLKRLQNLLYEVNRFINNMYPTEESFDKFEILKNTLDEVQVLIIKLKHNYNACRNDTLNETLEDLECSVRSVQLQLNEDGPTDLLKEACSTLESLVTSIYDIKDVPSNEVIQYNPYNLSDCVSDIEDTLVHLNNVEPYKDCIQLTVVMHNLMDIKGTIQSLKVIFSKDYETVIDRGIEVLQSLDYIEDKIFSLEKELDTVHDLETELRDKISLATHAVYSSLSNMRSCLNSTQKCYMYNNFGKPCEFFIVLIKQIGIISKISKNTKWTNFATSLRTVLNHFEDIKFYINLDKTARLPNDAAVTKTILSDLVNTIYELLLQNMDEIDMETNKSLLNTLNCVERQLRGFEEKVSIEVREKVPIFLELSYKLFYVYQDLRKCLEIENIFVTENILQHEKVPIRVTEQEKIEALDTSNIPLLDKSYNIVDKAIPEDNRESNSQLISMDHLNKNDEKASENEKEEIDLKLDNAETVANEIIEICKDEIIKSPVEYTFEDETKGAHFSDENKKVENEMDIGFEKQNRNLHQPVEKKESMVTETNTDENLNKFEDKSLEIDEKPDVNIIEESKSQEQLMSMQNADLSESIIKEQILGLGENLKQNDFIEVIEKDRQKSQEVDVNDKNKVNEPKNTESIIEDTTKQSMGLASMDKVKENVIRESQEEAIQKVDHLKHTETIDGQSFVEVRDFQKEYNIMSEIKNEHGFREGIENIVQTEVIEVDDNSKVNQEGIENVVQSELIEIDDSTKYLPEDILKKDAVFISKNTENEITFEDTKTDKNTDIVENNNLIEITESCEKHKEDTNMDIQLGKDIQEEKGTLIVDKQILQDQQIEESSKDNYHREEYTNKKQYKEEIKTETLLISQTPTGPEETTMKTNVENKKETTENILNSKIQPTDDIETVSLPEIDSDKPEPKLSDSKINELNNLKLKESEMITNKNLTIDNAEDKNLKEFESQIDNDYQSIKIVEDGDKMSSKEYKVCETEISVEGKISERVENLVAVSNEPQGSDNISNIIEQSKFSKLQQNTKDLVDNTQHLESAVYICSDKEKDETYKNNEILKHCTEQTEQKVESFESVTHTKRMQKKTENDIYEKTEQKIIEENAVTHENEKKENKNISVSDINLDDTKTTRKINDSIIDQENVNKTNKYISDDETNKVLDYNNESNQNKEEDIIAETTHENEAIEKKDKTIYVAEKKTIEKTNVSIGDQETNGERNYVSDEAKKVLESNNISSHHKEDDIVTDKKAETTTEKNDISKITNMNKGIKDNTCNKEAILQPAQEAKKQKTEKQKQVLDVDRIDNEQNNTERKSKQKEKKYFKEHDKKYSSNDVQNRKSDNAKLEIKKNEHLKEFEIKEGATLTIDTDQIVSNSGEHGTEIKSSAKIEEIKGKNQEQIIKKNILRSEENSIEKYKKDEISEKNFNKDIFLEKRNEKLDHSYLENRTYIRDDSLENLKPPSYIRKKSYTDTTVINTEREEKLPIIYKAQTLTYEAQLKTSTPQFDVSSGIRQKSKPLSETTLTERRSGLSRDIKKKPSFSTFLTDRTAVEGSRVKLTCSVLSSSELRVTWYKNGVVLDNKHKYKTKCIDGLITLEVFNAVPNDSAEYKCTVENEHGSITSFANLRVYPCFEASPIPPTFTRSIKDTYHLAENELVLECRIRGQPLPSITWLKDGIPISSNERYHACYLADGVCRLIIDSPSLNDSGTYTCKAENSVWSDQITHLVQFTGKESYHDMNITSLEKSRFNRQALESRRPHFTNVLTDYKVSKGGTIGLQVEIGGLPTRVEWLREGRSVTDVYKNAQTYVDHDTYTLALTDVTEKDSGLFTCRAWSSYGNVDMNASVTVIQPNETEGKPAIIISRPPKDIQISVAEDINISFRVQGEPKPKVIFMKGIRDISCSQRVCKMVSDDYVKYTLKRSVMSDAGTYCILARNAYGCDRAFVTVAIRQRASSESLISDWTYPMDETAISPVERNYKAVPVCIPGEPRVADGGNNWVSLVWSKPDNEDRAPVLAYKVESWLLGKEGGARWIELGITPRNTFDAFNLKQGEDYYFRITPRNRYGFGEPVQTTSAVRIGLAGDRPEFIDILPGQLKVLVGEVATLNCSFKGKPTPEIVWMKNGHEIDEEPDRINQSLNGENCCLQINNVQIEDEGRYSCEATNPFGRASTYARMTVITDRDVWEADAKLKRERSAGVEGDYPPQFTMRLRDRRVQATYPVRLTCQVIGYPAPTVTWFKNGEEVVVDSRHTLSQDEFFHTLEIAPTTLDDGGVYEAMARNGCGAISCRCCLVVDKGIRAYVAPEFCCGLEPLYRLNEGDELRISAMVEAYPSVGVTWYRDGVRLRPSRRAIMTLDRDGQIELALAFITARDAGVYTCTASNEVGTATTSGKVEVMVGDLSADKTRTPPVVISPDVPYSKEPMFIRKPRSSEAYEGDTVIIECEVIGDPKPDVYWLRDFLKPDYYRDAIHFKSVGAGPEYKLEIPHAKLDYTGAYSVVAKNVHGEAKAIISLQILAKDPTCSDDAHNVRYGRVDVIPRFDKDLTDLLCYDGDAVEFECHVSGNPEPDIRWFHYSEVVPDCSDFESSYEIGAARLKIKQVTAEDEGTYTCQASNNLGKASSSACLVVYPPGEPNTLCQRLRRPPALLSAASTPRSTPRSTPARSASRTPGPEARRGRSPARETAPKFYTYPFNKVVEEGETVVFKCAVKGLPSPWATWDKDGLVIKPTGRISIKEKDEMIRILEIEEVTIDDVGLYRITLENDFGRVEASARLEVITRRGKFYGNTRSYSPSPRRSVPFRRRTPSLTRYE